MENVSSSPLPSATGQRIAESFLGALSSLIFRVASNRAAAVSLGKVFFTNTIHCQEVILKLSLIFPFFFFLLSSH